MAITVDWTTKIISIPRDDLQLVQSTPTEIRQLDINNFRLTLKALESDVEGLPYLITHTHVAPISVGGVQLARVVEIINGYTVTFEDGQYAVNLVGANSNIGDRVNVNQVSVRSANSAGLTYSKEVEDQSFRDSRIAIDTINGLSGTNFPRGTPGDPVDNIMDAEAIIESRNLGRRLSLVGSISIGSGQSLDDYNIEGESYAKSVINLDATSTSQRASFSNCYLPSGSHNPLCRYSECLLVNSTNIEGVLERCKVGGVMYVSGDMDLYNCYGTVVLVPTKQDIDINIINFSGQITIAGATDPDFEVSIGVLSAVVVFDASCTHGSATVVDADVLIDNSQDGFEVTQVNQHLVTQGGLSQVGALVQEVHQIHGLDPTAPLNVTTTERSVGTITQAITGDGETTSTVTRTS